MIRSGQQYRACHKERSCGNGSLQPRHAFAGDLHHVAGGAALVRSGPELVLWLQQERRHQVLPQSPRVRSRLRHGALGRRLSAAGPFYNLTWREHGDDEANAATKTGFEHIAEARDSFRQGDGHRKTGWSRPWPAGFRSRMRCAPEEFDRWDDDYAAEMRRVYYSYPDDHDVMALFVEALDHADAAAAVERQDRARRRRVQTSSRPCRSATAPSSLPTGKACSSIRRSCICTSMRLKCRTTRKRAMRSADALATMCPDAGHMNHMPGHIYVLCGDYEKAKARERKGDRRQRHVSRLRRSVDLSTRSPAATTCT